MEQSHSTHMRRERDKNRRKRASKAHKNQDRLRQKLNLSMTAPPSLEDIDLESLDSLLRQFDHSHIHQDATRVEAIEYLEGSLVRWAQTLQLTKNPQAGSKPSASTINAWNNPTNPWRTTVNPAIVTFGSHRLGVSMEGSDLDLLVVAPAHITRNDFFGSWVDFLRKLPNVAHVHPIPEAYTPVLKFEINDINIDMLFCSLKDSTRLAQLPKQQRLFRSATNHTTEEGPIVRTKPRVEYQITDDDLRGQDDEKGLRSLNGARVSQMILELVPAPQLPSYRVVLRAVKHWAMCKGIYSNVLGFLGGINWAILVARVCCFHPKKEKATPAELLVSFYHMFSAWGWPNPVLLKTIQLEPPTGVAPMRVWDPMGCRDPAELRRYALEIMPIITPAYPAMNSAYNVGAAQFRRMKEELSEAFRNIQQMNFDALFRPGDFFGTRQTFLQVSIKATTRADFIVWFRYVESRLRILINNLDTPEIEAHPQAQFYYQSYNDEGEVVGQGWSATPDVPQEALYYIGLRGAKSVNLMRDTRPLVANFLHQVHSWDKREAGSMDISLSCVQACSLPACCASVSDTADEDISELGKLTPQTSASSVGDDSFASDLSGTSHDETPPTRTWSSVVLSEH